MKTRILTISTILFLTLSAGCASRCEPRMTFREWIGNRPRPISDLFNRGDECNNCNTPAGQISGFDYAASDCPDGLCNTSAAPSGPVGFYPSDQIAPTSVGYPPMRSLGEIGSGTMNPRSSGELEMPPMYGNGGN